MGGGWASIGKGSQLGVRGAFFASKPAPTFENAILNCGSGLAREGPLPQDLK